MLQVFKAGSDLVRWELTEVIREGTCRLAVHHAQGTIVEYHPDATKALTRLRELEDLLVRARGFTASLQTGTPS